MTKIVHIVLWKLSPTTTLSSAKSAIQNLQSLLAPGRISCVLSETVGPRERTQGYEFGLWSEFESMEALERYAVSEEHVECVNKHVKPHTSGSLAYDFEVPS